MPVTIPRSHAMPSVPPAPSTSTSGIEVSGRATSPSLGAWEGSRMTRFRYATATSLDGFIADEHNSLQWLFDVPGAEGAESDFGAFMEQIGAQVQGSTTYEWLLEHEPAHVYERPTFVFTTRDLPAAKGDVRFVRGP